MRDADVGSRPGKVCDVAGTVTEERKGVEVYGRDGTETDIKEVAKDLQEAELGPGPARAMGMVKAEARGAEVRGKRKRGLIRAVG